MGLAIIKYLRIFWIRDCTFIIARKSHESNLFLCIINYIIVILTGYDRRVYNNGATKSSR
nr:MAG TPA: hypothetical protein [Caudoviricetes sp.]DAV37734.1 MAG TPA: hypothetical protein [Bacteriophage sp.]